MITNEKAYKYIDDALTELRLIQRREADGYGPWEQSVNESISEDCQMLNFIAEKLEL